MISKKYSARVAAILLIPIAALSLGLGSGVNDKVSYNVPSIVTEYKDSSLGIEYIPGDIDTYVASVNAFFDGIKRAEEEAAAEAEREAARIAAASKTVVNSSSGSSFDAPSECTGKVLPAYIVQRESHCNYGAVNVTGCGGSGCYGMYQIHGMHWNGGACSDLNWQIPADQDECASRLSSGGTNLRPWAG